MAGLFSYDTLTDTAGTLLTAHIGQTGATWTKTGGQTADLQAVTGGQNFRLQNAGGIAYLKTSGVPTNADYDVQFDLYFPTHVLYATVAARQDGGTLAAGTGGYLAGYDGNLNQLNIFNGLTVIASASFTPSVGSTHTLRFSLRGTSLTLYLDGVSTVTATDSTYAAKGTAGLFSYINAGSPTDSDGAQIFNFGAIDAGSLAAGILSNSSITSSGGTFAMTTPVGGVYNYSYQLQRSAHSAGSYSNVGSAQTGKFNASTFTDGTASSGTAYDYRVVVTDSTGGTPLTATSNVVTITTGASTATTYTLAGPSSGTTSIASSNFTVQAVGTLSGGVTVTPHTSGTGTFSPTTVTLAAGTSTSATFTYTPGVSETATISTTNSSTLTDPAGVSYVSSSASATSYTFTGPTPRIGVRGSASGNFTISPVGGSYTGTITITPSGGGLSTPITLTFSGTGTPQTFAITPTAKGVVTLTPSASPALGTNPTALSYVSLPKVKVVFKGDSLTYGTNASSGGGTTGGTVYPGVVMTQLQGANSFYTSVNLGTAGQRLDTMYGNRATEIQPQFDATKDYNILVIQAGTNDLGGGNDGTNSGVATPVVAWSNMNSYVAAAKSYGFSVIVQTITPSSFSGYPLNFNETRDRFNDLIRSNWKSAGAVAISDTAADSRIGWDGNETNATYFSASDLTHLTDAGYAIVAGYATEAVQSAIDGATNNASSGGISRGRLQ
jgi:lysophospholipase L1-like esterase